MYEVLIVEDDPMVAAINKQYVNQNPNFRVAALCRDGDSALEYLTKNTVHLVILDLYMPGKDGLTLLREIRRRKLPVSVIMVTAANDGTSIEEALRLGIVDYLVKPFFAERFRQALQTFLCRENALQSAAPFDQRHIDAVIAGAAARADARLPKGIQAQTLESVMAVLEAGAAPELTAEEIADKVGLSRVTVRRYMNYLLEKGRIAARMNYGTGGRPCMLYSRSV